VVAWTDVLAIAFLIVAFFFAREMAKWLFRAYFAVRLLQPFADRLEGMKRDAENQRDSDTG